MHIISTTIMHYNCLNSTPTAGAVIGLAAVVALLAAALIVAVVVILLLLNTKKRSGKSVDICKSSMIAMNGLGK